ncbi:Tim44/TimA family putative adaptor protein [Hyphomicrobium sp.]|jgi:predicted lipid-binding transport protein (Tim44 family)|uniref:Tim44/TimA family putative adaptor protein n=1 Tax=Hyphomicrobium sp. TaxID=82 RepID=UPI002CFD409C|nr:Tim44/TimA family putative adaptor protein [Hyphomicrobium sp.]HVZ04916.1 Tim44/TimA family putative adaptor protein [Hyphomicrobium sp.]
MSGQFDFITLIALIVAVAAIIKLRSVLGHRTDDDEQRVERLRARQREASQRAGADGTSGDVITLPRRDRDTAPATPAVEATTADVESRIKAYPVTDPSITTGLLDIAKVDPAFDPEEFLGGAGRAYELIVSAFAEGNRRMLKDLLSKDVFEGFSSAIAEREARGETLDQQFVGIKKAEITETDVKNGIASITVRFNSELISATRDKAGEVISGDAQKIKDVTDIWTFSRDISSAKARSNPNWRLVATQAPN